MKTKNNERLNILIISAAFYPDNSPRSFRTTELAKALSRQGHEITVAVPGNYEKRDDFAKKHGIVVEDKATEITDKMRPQFFTSPVLARYGNRLLEWFFEFPDIQYRAWARRVSSAYSGFDALISIASPHAIHWGIAQHLKNKKERPAKIWIADCGDPFMGAKMNRLPKMPWFAGLEKLFCRTCDYITVPVASAKAAYYPEFHDKIRVIPQGFDFEESGQFVREYKTNVKPTFGYAGSLSPMKRDPRPLLAYLVSLDADFQFTLFTKANNLVEPWALKSGGRIQIKPYVERKELLGIMSTMDFLVNFENEVQEQVPSKLIDYYLIGRPVLSLKYHDDIPGRVQPFLNGDYKGAMSFQDIEKYQIENVVQNFLDLCEHVSKQ